MAPSNSRFGNTRLGFDGKWYPPEQWTGPPGSSPSVTPYFELKFSAKPRPLWHSAAVGVGILVFAALVAGVVVAVLGATGFRKDSAEPTEQKQETSARPAGQVHEPATEPEPVTEPVASEPERTAEQELAYAAAAASWESSIMKPQQSASCRFWQSDIPFRGFMMDVYRPSGPNEFSAEAFQIAFTQFIEAQIAGKKC